MGAAVSLPLDFNSCFHPSSTDVKHMPQFRPPGACPLRREQGRGLQTDEAFPLLFLIWEGSFIFGSPMLSTCIGEPHFYLSFVPWCSPTERAGKMLPHGKLSLHAGLEENSFLALSFRRGKSSMKTTWKACTEKVFWRYPGVQGGRTASFRRFPPHRKRCSSNGILTEGFPSMKIT